MKFLLLLTLPTFLAAIALSQEAPLPEYRTLTNTGGTTIEAAILLVEEGKVSLKRKSDGKEFTVPVTMFADADREWLNQWTPPPPPPYVPGISEFDINTAAGLNKYSIPEVDTHDESLFWVYVPESYHPDTPMPLVLSSHGNYNAEKSPGHPGEGEIKQWIRYADEYGFIVVCPSNDLGTKPGRAYAESNGYDVWDSTRKFFKIMLERVLGSFNIDREHVLSTGISGGGYPTWMSLDMPDIFTCACFRVVNWAGGIEDNIKKTNLRKWKERHIYYFSGARDTNITPDQVTTATAFLRDNCEGEKLLIEHLDIGHASKINYVVEWFVGDVLGRTLNSKSEKVLK